MIKDNFFDKIFKLAFLNVIEPFYINHKELFLYLIFGGLSFIVSIGTFAFLNINLEINELISNIISWIVTVLFAFFTNRVWVFSSSTKGILNFLKQMEAFFCGRVITLIVEEIILLIFITKLGFSAIFIKIGAQIIVILLNYIISKLIVFRKS